MLIYFSVIIFCFLLSTVRLPKYLENSALILIALFLCFGYMTGTDWYSYESYYNNVKLSQEVEETREFGYFLLQTLSIKLGLDFWEFHILIKLLVFLSLINFVRWLKVNIFLFLALFIPTIGLYLFVDCPFRNLIAFGFSLIAFKKLFQNQIMGFLIYTFIAINFHISALFLLLIFFIYKIELKNSIIVITTIIIYSIAFNTEFLITKLYLPLVKIFPEIDERISGYLVNNDFISNTMNLGSYIRLFIILIFIFFKNNSVQGGKYSSYIFNLSIIFLMLYPLGISVKIIQRIALYLSPFFALGIIYLLRSLQIRTNIYILSLFFILFSFWQTYSLVTVDFRYIPYTNYIPYFCKKDFPSMEYRYKYNKTVSPYKHKK